MRLLELKHSEQTVVLYRGDNKRIDVFDIEQTDIKALFGKGIYLTDSKVVAKDYAKKGINVFFEGDYPSKSKKSLLNKYLFKVMMEELNLKEKVYMATNKKYEPEFPRSGPERVQAIAMLKLAVKHVVAETLAKAVTLWNQRRKNVKFHTDTTGAVVMIDKSVKGSVSEFHIPTDYMARVLDGEAPLPDKALKVVRDTFDAFRRSKGGSIEDALDFRSVAHKDSLVTKHLNFDQFIKYYKSHGSEYAWSDDDVRGGDNQNPSFDFIFNGQHAGEILKIKEFQDHLIAGLMTIGYVGFKYDGGIRAGGALARGGGGLRHTAYSFWNAEYINAHRVNDEEPEDARNYNPKVTVDDYEFAINSAVGESVEIAETFDTSLDVKYRG